MRKRLSSDDAGTRRRGSVMMFTVVVLVVVGTTILALSAAVTENVHKVRRSEDRLQAFYGAESGLHKSMDWFNRPGAAPLPDYFKPLPNGDFVDDNGRSVLLIENRGSVVLEGDSLPQLTMLDAAGNREKGELLSIVIEPPEESDPSGAVARITSVSQTRDVKATVMALLSDNDLPEIRIPAALIDASGHALSSNGLFQVSWGEIWADGDVELNNPISNKFPSTSDDEWFVVKAEGNLLYKNGYADGRSQGGSSSNAIAPNAPNYEVPFLESSLHPKNKSLKGYENLMQHQSLDFPKLRYDDIKMLCLDNGYPVLRTTASGQLVIGQDENGEDITQSFDDYFDSRIYSDPDQVDRRKMPPIYLVDTMDGLPPAANGSNLTNIKVAGQGPFFFGYIFVAANLSFGGAGNSPDYDYAELPDGSTYRGTVKNVRHYGLLYLYGTGDFQGQGAVYGAVFAERGFSGGGNWSIYYDKRLDDPRRGKIGSQLKISLWNTSFGDEDFNLVAAQEAEY